MIGDLHLFFQHRDALGEVVMRPHFAGQLFQLGFGHGLALAVGDQNADQRDCTGNEGNDDTLHLAYASRSRSSPFFAMILV